MFAKKGWRFEFSFSALQKWSNVGKLVVEITARPRKSLVQNSVGDLWGSNHSGPFESHHK